MVLSSSLSTALALFLAFLKCPFDVCLLANRSHTVSKRGLLSSQKASQPPSLHFLSFFLMRTLSIRHRQLCWPLCSDGYHRPLVYKEGNEKVISVNVATAILQWQIRSVR